MQHYILGIDDDELVCLAIKRIVQRTRPDIRVLTATTAQMGLDLARQLGAVLCLIVLDVHLPDIDGRKLAAEMRTLLPDTALLPLTGNELAIPELLALGCEQPLIKPYPLRSLLQRIIETLESSQQQAHTRNDTDRLNRQRYTQSNFPVESV